VKRELYDIHAYFRYLEQGIKVRRFLIQLHELYSTREVHAGRMSAWIMPILIGLNIAACSSVTKPASNAPAGILPVLCSEEQQEIERLKKLLVEREAQQNEIERLQKLLAEKEAQIRAQQARQQDQAKTLQETSSQAAHAQVKLRRLATRPAAASTIAEVEIALENLKSTPLSSTEQALGIQAKRLLDAAATSYSEDNYGAAMDQAAQAGEFIDMVKNNRLRKASDPHQVTVSLQIPIPMRAVANANLRHKPGVGGMVASVLQKDSLITSEAYRGDWLLVQTVDGRSGWVLNTLVEAVVGTQ
jgi:vacuolar-type H+-ATPase subunit I/STV1